MNLQSTNLRYRATDVATGGEVSLLQDFLNTSGYLSVEPTGFFGPATLRAVQSFQRANGFSSTGYVGPLTRAKIRDLSCGSNVTPTIPTVPPSTNSAISITTGSAVDANHVNYTVQFNGTVSSSNGTSGASVTSYFDWGFSATNLINQSTSHNHGPISGNDVREMVGYATVERGNTIYYRSVARIARSNGNDYFRGQVRSYNIPLVNTPIPPVAPTTCTYRSNSNGVDSQNLGKPGVTVEDCRALCTNYRNDYHGRQDNGRCAWKNSEGYSTVINILAQTVIPTLTVSIVSAVGNVYGNGDIIPIRWSASGYPEGTQIRLRLQNVFSTSQYNDVDYIPSLNNIGSGAYDGYRIPTNNSSCSNLTVGSFSSSNCWSAIQDYISQGKTKFIITGELWSNNVFLGTRSFSQPFTINASSSNSCTSPVNVCGLVNTGTIINGVCSATTPTYPAIYGASCSSPVNSCGQRNTGTIRCDGLCSATYPSDSSCPIPAPTPVPVPPPIIYPTPPIVYPTPVPTPAVIGTLSISVSASPLTQMVVSGSSGITVSNIQLDATTSAEDLNVSAIRLAYTDNMPVDVNTCQIFDGPTSLNTGANIVNPNNGNISQSTYNFAFNNAIIVPRRTTKILAVKCTIPSSATNGSFSWGLSGENLLKVTGLSSGNPIIQRVTPNAGSIMTVATAGSYTVTNDTSFLYKMSRAGVSNVELARLRFTAGASEDVSLRQMALQLGNPVLSSPSDLINQRVTLWNGATQIGTVQFGVGASPDNATSTLLSPAPLIPAGESILITVKGDLTVQNINEGTPGAFLAVTYDGDNNGVNGNYATGARSGSTISGSTADVNTNGTRIFRTVPSVAVISSGGTLSAGADLYRFVVNNPNSRDVVFQKFTMSIVSNGGNVNGFTLYGDGIAFGPQVTLAGTSGGNLEIKGSGTSNAQIIPANSSKTFVLRAAIATDVAGVSEVVIIRLLADTSYPICPNLMCTVAQVETGIDNANNIIWSPFSVVTPSATLASQGYVDWTNSYGMPGFPSNSSFPEQIWSRMAFLPVNNNLANVSSAFNQTNTETLTPVAESFSYQFTHDLDVGSPYTEDVIALQTIFTKVGLYFGEVTGGFYNQTYSAVRDFQRKYGIISTGYVGPTTRAKLNELY